MCQLFCLATAVLRALGIAALAALAAAMAPGEAYAASTVTTLYAFCRQQNCPNGSAPEAGLVMDANGDLFGTAAAGGNKGVLFKLTPNGSGYDYSVLRRFCSKTNCTDGSFPVADVIIDTAGNLYTTTSEGGKVGCGDTGTGCGVIVKVMPDKTWKVIHDFDGTHGSNPSAGLTYAGQASGEPWDGSSPLFGTAATGGRYGSGVVYKLTTDGSRWYYNVIHAFNLAYAPTGLIMDGAGNLFGTTVRGGVTQYADGTLYELANGTWTQTILHNFGGGTDGCEPQGKLVMDASGNLFGTTALCGTGGFYAGVAFEWSSGAGYGVIYDFCSLTNCSDGAVPSAGLVLDSSGHLFGTTLEGGSAGLGVAFELTNANGTWSEAAIHSFCTGRCFDGANPAAPLIRDASGSLFGTARGGGRYNGGTVFTVTP